jgi:hypothetical protein
LKEIGEFAFPYLAVKTMEIPNQYEALNGHS